MAKSGQTDHVATPLLQLMRANDVDEETLDLLAIVMRYRPATVEELVARSGATIETSRAGIRRLAAAGILVYADNEIHLQPPEEALTRALAEQVRRQADAAAALIAGLQYLPVATAEWRNDHRTRDNPLRARVTANGIPARVAWEEYQAPAQGRATRAVIPDMSAFIAAAADRPETDDGMFAGFDKLRAIIPTAATRDPDTLAVIEYAMAAGCQIRTLAELPSYFWVEVGTAVALPLNWGDSWPASVLMIEHAAVADALGELFEILWARSTPARQVDEEWEPVIGLLATGASDEQIAENLGISVRTVRRRISEAMLDLDATTRFTLGIAWANRP